ncbi:hypothetical protein HYFRA_00009871 [Hymenoscyphus fraxineus]|uniref:Uncharacterized protein n=1 Tax=Hymenoscyphus fraxineus TaxID=746836 RepID=A0A9N9L1N5_9HELO|nr:hypothetical protein HYFRA_00009871 [Hymenoscyphus fraxineus]
MAVIPRSSTGNDLDIDDIAVSNTLCHGSSVGCWWRTWGPNPTSAIPSLERRLPQITPPKSSAVGQSSIFLRICCHPIGVGSRLASAALYLAIHFEVFGYPCILDGGCVPLGFLQTELYSHSGVSPSIACSMAIGPGLVWCQYVMHNSHALKYLFIGLAKETFDGHQYSERVIIISAEGSINGNVSAGHLSFFGQKRYTKATNQSMWILGRLQYLHHEYGCAATLVDAWFLVFLLEAEVFFVEYQTWFRFTGDVIHLLMQNADSPV